MFKYESLLDFYSHIWSNVIMPPEQKNVSARGITPRPVERALQRLGRDISIARRVRRLSQEDLAERVGTSLSTIRRMEDGYPGTALHTFLGVLHVLGRLDDVLRVMTTESDALGMELVREQLPQRVRTTRVGKPRADRPAASKEGLFDDSDELEGF